MEAPPVRAALWATPAPEGEAAKPVETKPAIAKVAALKPVEPKPAEPVAKVPKPAPIDSKTAEKFAAQHNQAGRELLKQGKYREAVEELSAALEQKPDFTLALNARGFAYYLLKDPKKALADFDEAIRLNPKYLNAYQNRAKARKAAGDAAGGAGDEQKIREIAKGS